MKRFLQTSLAVLAFFGVLSCTKDVEVTEDSTVDVSGVSVDPVSLTLTVGETASLTASVVPGNATDPSVTWSSSDSDVVTVSEDGTLTALAEGQATVSVTTNDGGYTASCSVEVVSDVTDSSEDLSADATANCYIISAAGTYRFNATVMGNGASTEGLTPSVLSPEGAKLVWQTSVGMISDVEYADGYITFTADGTYGNALLAALDGDGEIIWSWHIWSCGLDLEPYTTKTGYDLMPVNLGATVKEYEEASVAQTYGLLYQWGRKDPFPNASTPTGDTSTVGGPVYDADGNEVSILYSSWYDTTNNTLEYSIANPTTCLSNYSQYSSSRDWLAAEYTDDALWGNPYGNQRDADNNWQYTGEKSIYDPCPAGWMVPPPGVFSTFTTTGNYTWDYSSMDIYDVNGDGVISEDDFMYGWFFMTEDGALFFPAAGRYDGSYAMLYGSVCGLWGAYWSNSPALEASALADGMAFCPLAFAVNQVSPSASASRADAYSVRCIREL